jgi:hypothetical protein
VWRKLNAVPKALRIVVVAVTILAVFSATNLAYHVVLKPTEVFAPVSGTFNKTPIETWRQYAPLFQEYSTASISPGAARRAGAGRGCRKSGREHLLAVAADLEPLRDLTQPASSSVGHCIR